MKNDLTSDYHYPKVIYWTWTITYCTYSHSVHSGNWYKCSVCITVIELCERSRGTRWKTWCSVHGSHTIKWWNDSFVSLPINFLGNLCSHMRSKSATFLEFQPSKEKKKLYMMKRSAEIQKDRERYIHFLFWHWNKTTKFNTKRSISNGNIIGRHKVY